MMETIQFTEVEKQIAEENNPLWVRTLAPDGSGKKTKVDFFEKSGSKSTLKGFRLPNINTRAVKVASFRKISGYVNASVMVCADSFGISFYGIIGVSVVGENIFPFAKLNVHKTNGSSRILFVYNGSFIDMYITGSYDSTYSMSTSSVFSMSEYVSFDGIGNIVDVEPLVVTKDLTIGSDT